MKGVFKVKFGIQGSSLSESTIKSAMLSLIEKIIFKTKQGSLTSHVNSSGVKTT